MDINKRLIDLFKKLDNSELTNKAELKAEVKCCVDAMMQYFSVVSDEQLHCIEKTNNNLTSIMMLEKKRSKAHDDAINACSRINDICHEVKLDEVFDFDTTDRRKVAAACGLLAGELYFSNLDNETTLKDYVTFADRNLYDTECFAWVLARNVAERLSCYSYIENFEPVYASLKDKTVELEYSDSKGKRVSVCDEIDVSRLYEPGYINKQVNLFLWDIVSVYDAEADGVKPAPKPKPQENNHNNTLDRFERITELFVSEFKGWVDDQVDLHSGDYDWIIHNICELMVSEFNTHPDKMADIIPPFDFKLLDSKMNSWSEYYHFSYEETAAPEWLVDYSVKYWILTNEDESRRLCISLSNKGYFHLWIEEKQKNGSYSERSNMYSYNLESLDFWLWKWSNGDL